VIDRARKHHQDRFQFQENTCEHHSLGHVVPKIVQIAGREIVSKSDEKNPRSLRFSERGQKERQLKSVAEQRVYEDQLVSVINRGEEVSRPILIS
jgi:hypothetical protein